MVHLKIISHLFKCMTYMMLNIGCLLKATTQTAEFIVNVELINHITFKSKHIMSWLYIL